MVSSESVDESVDKSVDENPASTLRTRHPTWLSGTMKHYVCRQQGFDYRPVVTAMSVRRLCVPPNLVDVVEEHDHVRSFQRTKKSVPHGVYLYLHMRVRICLAYVSRVCVSASGIRV